MALSSVFRHLKTLLATRLVFHLFWRWWPVAHVPAATKCCRVKAWSAKNFRHCYLGLSNSCWTILIGSSLRSLPFSIMLCCTTAWFKQLCGFASWPSSGSIYIYCSLACVASVSIRLIAWKLQWAKKKRRKGEGDGRRRNANPTILENAPSYFTVWFICKLTACQNRTDYPWITRFVKLRCSLIKHVPGNCKNCNKKGLR